MIGLKVPLSLLSWPSLKRKMALIYHIADREDWEKAQEIGEYMTPNLSDFGFIHCSTRDQIIKVANFQYEGQRNKELLEIDEELLNVRVEYEKVPGAPFDEKFPHVYGPIEVDAVVGNAPFEPNSEGRFEFPDELEG